MEAFCKANLVQFLFPSAAVSNFALRFSFPSQCHPPPNAPKRFHGFKPVRSGSPNRFSNRFEPVRSDSIRFLSKLKITQSDSIRFLCLRTENRFDPVRNRYPFDPIRFKIALVNLGPQAVRSGSILDTTGSVRFQSRTGPVRPNRSGSAHP